MQAVQTYPHPVPNLASSSLPIPHPSNLGMSHLLLQLKNPIHQRLARRRTPWDVYIHWHDAITSPRHAIAVMVISTPIGTASHTDHPSGIGHLIVHLAERRGHFVGERARNDHHVRLARGGAENYAETVLIVAGGGE
ncbi:hypothetical protein MMC06_006295, partial [Schaereria dolodes]|nr:hypothetical protein [Schaereria dolodes]